MAKAYTFLDRFPIIALFCLCYFARFADMGLSGAVPKALPLSGPGLSPTKAHTIRLGDGLLTTVYNDMDILTHRPPEDEGNIIKLCASVSWNDGQSWR